MSELNSRKVKTLAMILAIDKNQYDEMIYRYLIIDENDKFALPGGELKRGVESSKCIIDYINEQLGIDIMQAGENQAILGYSSSVITNPEINQDEDVIILFDIKIQLQYINLLIKNGKLTNSKLALLNPETHILGSEFSESWQKELLMESIKERFGEDYFDDLPYGEEDSEDDEDEEE